MKVGIGAGASSLGIIAAAAAAASAPAFVPSLVEQRLNGGDTGFVLDVFSQPETMRTNVGDAAPAAEEALVGQVLSKDAAGTHATTAAKPKRRKVIGYDVLELSGTSHLEIPDTMSFDRRNVTFITAILHIPAGAIHAIFNSPRSTTSSAAFHHGQASAGSAQLTGSPAYNPVTDLWDTSQVRIIAQSWSGTERLLIDGKRERTAAALSAGVTNGAYLFAWNTAGFRGPQFCLFYAVIRRAVGIAELRELYDDVYARLRGLGVPRTSNRNIVVDGSSLFAGVHLLQAQRDPRLASGSVFLDEALYSYGNQLALLYPAADRPRFHSRAGGGKKFAPTTGNMSEPGNITALNNELLRNAAYGSQAFIIDCPTNDIWSDGASLLNLQTWLGNILAGLTAIPDARKFMTTHPQRAGTAAQVQRANEYDAWLRATFGTRVIDDANDVRLRYADQNVYLSDNTHGHLPFFQYRAQNAKPVLDAAGV